MSDVFDPAIDRVARRCATGARIQRLRGELRATPTVANTWDEVEQLIAAMG